jgi:hypothetical protein
MPGTSKSGNWSDHRGAPPRLALLKVGGSTVLRLEAPTRRQTAKLRAWAADATHAQFRAAAAALGALLAAVDDEILTRADAAEDIAEGRRILEALWAGR